MVGKSLARQRAEQIVLDDIAVNTAAHNGKYSRYLDRVAHGYALAGYTNDNIAEFIGVDVSTIERWSVEYPSFALALKKGRTDDYVRLVRSAHRAGNGFRAREDKLLVVGGKVEKHSISKVYPPNMVATTLLLTNRQGDRWKDKRVGDASAVTAADLLEAIEEVAQRRAAKLTGDQAKVIEGTASEAKDGE